MVEPYRTEAPATLSANRKHCFACAAILDVRAELCPTCGVRQPTLPGMAPPPVVVMHAPPPMPTTTRSKGTAALLAFLLGGLGVHKFYLGRGGMGVVYLLFCWTFIPAIVAFIETFILIGMSDQEFAMKYPG